MYRGFILDSNILSKGFIESYQMDGEQVICDQKKVVVSSIEPYRTALTIKGQDVVALDAKKIAENIFPKDKYSIFLSHSHADYKDNSSVVKALIGWFKTELCIDVFVDAVIWANISDLLYEMDRAHCLNTVSSPAIFDYRKRNMSTAIAHTILSSSLTTMIDNCECFLLVDTPRSVFSNDIDAVNTFSPWIFHEIYTSSIIKSKKPIRLGATSPFIGESYEGKLISKQPDPLAAFDVNISHLAKLIPKDLLDIFNEGSKGTKFLDKLYSKHPNGQD